MPWFGVLARATIILFAVLGPLPARAQTTIFWNNSGSTFLTPTNWVGGVAPTNSLTANIAAFTNATVVSNPMLTASRSVNGLLFGAGTAAWNFSAAAPGGDDALTIGTGGIVNNSTNTQTFSNADLRIQLGANTTFSGAAGALLIAATVDRVELGGFNLTLNGAVGGTIAADIRGTGSLIKTGAGTWTLSDVSTYTGTTSVGTAGGASAGTLVLGVNNALPGTAVNVFAGTLDVNTRTDTIGSLSLGGGATGTTAQVLIGNGGVLTPTSTITYSASNNPNGALISGTGTGSLALTATRTFDVGDSSAATNDLTISAIITGAFGLTKTGTGALALSGVNTYTGTNTISAGTVRVGANANLGTGAVVLNGGTLATTNTMTLTAGRTLSFGAGGGTLDVSSGTTFTYDGVIAGTGTLSKEGAGTLQTGGTAANTWTGPLAVNAGTFEITKQGFIGAIDNAAAVTVSNGATLRFNGNATYTQETIGSLSGSGTVINSGGAAVNFVISGASNTTFSGVITDTANNLNLIKTGTSTITLSGSNSYDGTTAISNGVIIAANNTALGTTANGTTVVSGASLGLQGGITVSNESLSIAGTGVGANGALRNLSGTNTYTGGIAMTNATEFQSDAGRLNISNNVTAANFGLTVDGAGNTAASGTLALGTGGLTKTGAGTLFLTGSNTYSGGTLISSGALQLGEGGTIGSLATNSTITNNGTLIFNRSDNIAQGSAFSGAPISGTGSLIQNGAGTVTLGASNSYSGTTTINTGAIRVTNGSALGSVAGGTFVASGAALEIAGGIAVVAEPIITLNGSGIGGTGALRSISGSNTYGGLITLGSSARVNTDSGTLNITNTATITGSGHTLSFGGAGNTILQSEIATGTGGLVKDGAGTLILAGNNSCTGGTLISAGTLQVSSDANLGGVGGGVDFDQTGNGILRTTAGFTSSRGFTFSTAGTIDVTTNGLVLDGSLTGAGTLIKTGAGTLVIATDNNTQSGGVLVSSGVLQIGNGGAVGSLNGGSITNNASLTVNRTGSLLLTNIISGTGSLTNVGSGTLTLTAANSYTGPTVISAGTLSIGDGGTNGSLSTSSTITNNGTLIFDRSDTIAQGTDFSTAGISGTGSLVKEGGGSLTLTAENSYAGTTLVQAGTLVLASASSNAVTGSSITVESGATLVLAGNNQIGDSTGLILNGGTFITGNASAGYSDTLGTLTLNADSVIDLGSFSTGLRTLNFADSSGIAWATNAVLTISNWQGLQLESSSVAQILFGTGGLTTAQLSQIRFAPFDTRPQIDGGVLIGAGGELVPIPEPRVYAAALALLAAVAWRERKRLASLLLRR